MAGGGPDFGGIIGVCLTPFTPEGAVDLAALEREVDYVVERSGVDAVAIAATEDSEYTMLDLDERRELMARGAEMVGDRLPLMLGISHPAPERAAELAHHAAEVGANLVQLVMPIRLWGGDPDPDEIYDYCAEIARQSPLPVCITHNRQAGADPAIPTFLRLADIYNVHSFVDTAGDITRTSRLVEEIDRRGSARYFGTAESLLITLTLGGSGAALPPPVCTIGAEVVHAFREGDAERAAEWQRILSLFPGRWSRYGLPPVMKAAMRHLGIDLGRPARPFGPVNAWDDQAIGQFLEEVGLKEPGEEAFVPAAASLAPPGLRRDLLRR